MNSLYQKEGLPDDRYQRLETAVLGGQSVRVAIARVYGYGDAYYKATSREQQAHIRQCKPCSSPAFTRLSVRMPTERVMAVHAAAGRNQLSVNRWVGRVILAAIRKEAEGNV